MYASGKGFRVSIAIAGFTVAALLGGRAPASAQCVGDCDGVNHVTISNLIVGVNIALGLQRVDVCPAFANDMGKVDIAQLIQGVNNALKGCPVPVATPTATDTATEAPTATATDTPVEATATATPVEATATATDTPPEATATATDTPVEATATATDTPPEATATATSTMPATATITNTPAPTATATEAVIPPGESVAGRAAVVSTGLGGIQSIVAAVVAIVTNKGSGSLMFGLDQEIGGPADVDNCPISGTTSQDCTEMGSGATKTIHLVLGAVMCVAPGPAGGTGEFDGTNAITIDSNPLSLNNCSGPLFLSGMFTIDMLSVILRNEEMQNLLTVAVPQMEGTLSLTPSFASCLVSALDLTLNGVLESTLTDGSGVQVFFNGTQVKFDQITFNSDCVPLAYRLTFNGNATFSPMVVPPGPAGGGPVEDQFLVTFTNFQLKQDATTSPVKVEMSGSMASDCFGGSVTLATAAMQPVAVAAGHICPDSGTVNVTSSHGNAQVTYLDETVTVTPQGGMPKQYSSCLDAELLMCLPQ